MRLLVLYPELTHVPPLYVRRLAVTMAEKGHVVYGPGREGYVEGRSVPEVVEQLGPFGGVLALEPKYCWKWVEGLALTQLKKAVLLTDYVDFKEQVRETNKFLDKCAFDILFHHTAVEGRNAAASGRGERAVFLPFGVDTSFLQVLDIDRPWDVAAMWCENQDAYPQRAPLREALVAAGLRVFSDRVVDSQYVTALNRSRICVTSAPVCGNWQSRFMEAPACGCLLLTDPVEELAASGFVDGANIAVYRSPEECVEKALYFAANEGHRRKVADAGRKFVVGNFSNQRLIAAMEREMTAFERPAAAPPVEPRNEAPPPKAEKRDRWRHKKAVDPGAERE